MDAELSKNTGLLLSILTLLLFTCIHIMPRARGQTNGQVILFNLHFLASHADLPGCVEGH